jgi:DNA invertase Pin-like site-specific DNA recombinase
VRLLRSDQDLTVQVQALKAAGCELVRSEKVTGTTTDGRAELAALLEFAGRAMCWW